MSPEQAHGARDIDARTDVWSAGIMLFELLAHQLPWEATTLTALLLAITTVPAHRRPRRRRPLE